MNICERVYLAFFRRLNRLRLYFLKCRGAKIGKNTKAYGKFTVLIPSNLKIGNNCTINENVHINCRDVVQIGNDVRISTGVQIHTAQLLIDSFPREHTNKPILIKDNVWIASGSIITCGVTIGENSVVSANSVVLNNLESNSLYAGNPAKKIKNF